VSEKATRAPKESAGWERRGMVTDAAGYQQLIDAALTYGDTWRAREAFGKQFRQEPSVDQAFLKATAAQLDKNLTDSRRNLERAPIRLESHLSEQRRSSKKRRPREETDK
jgi:hypothetical protein